MDLSLIEEFIQEQIQSNKKECTLFIGIQGPQGIGKSTLCHSLNKRFKNACILSIDDFYKPRSELIEMCEKSGNKLFECRGLPGSHDLELLEKTISELCFDDCHEILIPKYDKSLYGGKGDRLPQSEWRLFTKTQRLDFVLLEGWCVGFEPIPSDHLAAIIESWEQEFKTRQPQKRTENCKSKTKRLEIEYLEINNLVVPYQRVFKKMHVLIKLEALDFEFVYEWRNQQEEKLVLDMGSGMSAQQVVEFVDRFMPLYYFYSHSTGSNSSHENFKQMILFIDFDRQIKKKQMVNGMHQN